MLVASVRTAAVLGDLAAAGCDTFTISPAVLPCCRANLEHMFA